MTLDLYHGMFVQIQAECISIIKYCQCLQNNILLTLQTRLDVHKCVGFFFFTYPSGKELVEGEVEAHYIPNVQTFNTDL